MCLLLFLLNYIIVKCQLYHQLTSVFLLQGRNFFDDQSTNSPACVPITWSVFAIITFTNRQTNDNTTFGNVFTEAIQGTRTMVVQACYANRMNRSFNCDRRCAFIAIDCDEPASTGIRGAYHSHASVISNSQGCVWMSLSKVACLAENKIKKKDSHLT